VGLSISIVIPTHNRKQILAQTLRRLKTQVEDMSDAVEIVVVDDGSIDDTATLVQSFVHAWDIPLHYEYQVSRGPAAARNRGLRVARGRWVLFIGDDIYAGSGLLKRHLYTHESLHSQPKIAVLGRVVWDPSLNVSPFMRWWGDYRLNYPRQRKPRFVEPWRFYTCNVSVDRNFILSHGGFDPSFSAAALEDTELAWRLSSQGLRIYYDPEALAYHHHPTDLHAACRQMEVVGRSASTFRERTGRPALSYKWRLMACTPWMSPTVMRPLMQWAEQWQDRFAFPFVWISLLTYSFLVGCGRKPRLDSNNG
jgi:glycosyltransferase involved in cell wall biosynthesis